MGFKGVTSEAQEAQVIATQNGSSRLIDTIVRMNNEQRSAEEIGAAVRRGNLQNARVAADTIARLGPTAAAMQGNILLTANSGYLKLLKTQKDEEGLEKNERIARDRQIKAQASQAAALERAVQGMKDFGNGLLMTVWGVIAPMAPMLQQFARWIASLVVGAAQLAAAFTGSGGFKEAVAGVTDWFTKTAADIKAAYNKGGFVGAFGELFKKSIDGIQKIWSQLEPVVVPVVKQAFQGIMEFLQPWFEKALSAVFDSISDFLNDKLGIGESKNARLARQKEQDTGQYKAWLEYMKSATAPMFARGML
jgi:hypothetical protein